MVEWAWSRKKESALVECVCVSSAKANRKQIQSTVQYTQVLDGVFVQKFRKRKTMTHVLMVLSFLFCRFHSFFFRKQKKSSILLLYANFRILNGVHTYAFKMLLKRTSYRLCSLLFSYLCCFFSVKDRHLLLCIVFIHETCVTLSLCVPEHFAFQQHQYQPFPLWGGCFILFQPAQCGKINRMNEHCCFHNNLMICTRQKNKDRAKTTTQKERYKHIDTRRNEITS